MIDSVGLSCSPMNQVHLSFTVSLSTSVQEIGNQNSITLAGAELRARYVHGAKAMSLGTLGWKTTQLQAGSKHTFSNHMNATFHRDDFWGAWMITDYYDNHVQLHFGPLAVQFDLMPHNLLSAWVLGSSDAIIAYSYSCNYTIFVQALFYNSMVCIMPPKADMNDVYRHLRTLSLSCYLLGTAFIVLFVLLRRYWFPPVKPIVAAVECHGEEPHVEARMSDLDLSRPIAPCDLDFNLADVTLSYASGEIIFIPGNRLHRNINDTVLDYSVSRQCVEEVRLCKLAYDPAPEAQHRAIAGLRSERNRHHEAFTPNITSSRTQLVDLDVLGFLENSQA